MQTVFYCHVYHCSLRFISYKATLAKEKQCLQIKIVDFGHKCCTSLRKMDAHLPPTCQRVPPPTSGYGFYDFSFDQVIPRDLSRLIRFDQRVSFTQGFLQMI